MSEISNVVKQKWFMPVALGVAGLSFILFLKKSNSGDGTTQYQDYSAVPAEKAEAIMQSMANMEDRINEQQLSYLNQMTSSLSSITDQIKDVELLTKNPSVYEQPTASVPVPVINPTPIIEPAPVPVDPMQAAFTHNAANYENIMASINLSRLNNPNDELYKTAHPAPAPAPVKATVKTTSAEYVKIPKGATLSEIAKANNTTVSKIVSLNNGKITNPNKIKAGDNIRVK